MHSSKIKLVNPAEKSPGTEPFFSKKKLQPGFFSGFIQREPESKPATTSTVPASSTGTTSTGAASTLSFNPNDPIGSAAPGLIDSFTSMVVQSSSLSKYITKSYSPISKQFKSYDHYHGNDNPKLSTFWNDDWHNAVSSYLGTKNANEVLDVGGFYNRNDDTINLPKDAYIGSAMHEAVHRLGSEILKAQSNPLNEGVTQYFTDLLFAEFKIPPFTKHNYKAQLIDACKLVQHTSLDLVAKTYFQKNTKALASILTTLGVLGHRRSGSGTQPEAIQKALDALPAPVSCP